MAASATAVARSPITTVTDARYAASGIDMTMPSCVHMKDVIKKGGNDELPDFYNIVLERPRDDAAGFDVLFIDAASKVSPVSCCRTMCDSTRLR